MSTTFQQRLAALAQSAPDQARATMPLVVEEYAHDPASAAADLFHFATAKCDDRAWADRAAELAIEIENDLEARKQALLAIATEHLDIRTFERANSGADFQEQAVWTIEAALEAAYEAGRASK